uniref:Cupiennin-4b n=1 Tax=Cupiennius salei TaxID=6928 RepID=TXC4B_CUPSA|nr:RecName: Full=Cupiennin-4b; Short=Cu-4b; AltName: Full=Short cationic peptide-4b; Short=SCP-4b [Cupiennius salei]
VYGMLFKFLAKKVAKKLISHVAKKQLQ